MKGCTSKISKEDSKESPQNIKTENVIPDPW